MADLASEALETDESINYISSYYKWQRVEPINPDAAPSPRQWFSMTLYRRALYIFGGVDTKKNILNDLHKFDIVSSQWIRLTTKHSPPARYRHSAVVYHNGLYIVGGVNSNNEAYDDVWHYDFGTNRWKVIKKLKLHFISYLTAVTCGKARIFGSGMFGQANAHQLTYIYDCDLSERSPKITVVGNFEVDSLREASIQRYKEDLFLLTEDTLFELNKDNQLTFVKLPVPLKGAALASIDDHMFIIGGQLPNKEISRDTYIYSIKKRKFSKLSSESSALPTLYNHRAVASLGSIFIFSGVGPKGDEAVNFNDIYQYSDTFKLLPNPSHISHLSAWQLLPNDILHHVFSFMNGEHLARSLAISKGVYHLLNRPYFKTQMKKCQFSIIGSDELKRKRFFVVLIGPSKSGKTSVVRRLVDKAYQGYVDVDLVWYQREIKHEYGETDIDIYVPFSRQSLTVSVTYG
eukprot:TRINITY_DN7804_c0_g1_i1.p1 TRINITY_DN7804_c0_g1~~TRINITY_DN7804_c0_g1_i1.p1  ORF type:complete len:461 (+),score=58.55 TRINITY_DN7804_c0_g1_i1:53-1435(+)